MSKLSTDKLASADKPKIVVNPANDRIREALAARGYSLPDDGTPPTVDAIRGGNKEVKWSGRDYDPSRYVYCRATANNLPAIDRLVARGYVPLPGNAQVQLEGCYGGAEDVILYADRDAREDFQASAYYERMERRGEVDDPERGATRRTTRTHLGAAGADHAQA